MDYNTILGMVVSSLILIGGFFFTVRTNFKKDEAQRIEELNQMNKLNLNIVELTHSIKYMSKNDEVRDQRINARKKEIEKLDDKVQEHDKKLIDHESRIKCLEDSK